MKKILFLLCLLFTFMSCSDSKDEPDQGGETTVKPEIEIPTPEVVLPETSEGVASSTSVKFKSSAPWSINLSNTRAVPSWFTVSPMNGEAGDATITITITEDNPSYEDRSGYIVIKVGDVTKTIVVSQKKKEAIIASKDRYDVTPAGDTFSVEVKSNVSYEVIVPDDFKDWLKHKKVVTRTAGLTATTENFEVAEGSENNNREGIIVFKSGALSDTVSVFQAMKNVLTLNTEQLNVSYLGSNDLPVEVRTNVKFAVSIPDSIKSWVTLIEPENRAVRVDRFHLKIAKNETFANRRGEITIKDLESDFSTTLTIQQAQEDAIILSDKQVDVDTEGGVVEAEVESNITYKVKILNNATWVKQLPTSRALKREIVKFSVDEIKDNTNREAKVVFINDESNVSDTLTISQSMGSTLILSQKTFDLASDASNIDVKLLSNIDYKITIADSIKWITRAENKSLKEDNLKFTIAENSTYDNRSALIIFEDKISELKDTVTINQASKNALILGLKDLLAPSTDTLINVELRSNVKYEVIMPANANWIVENKTRGLNLSVHQFQIKENTTYDQRMAKIVFKDAVNNISDTLKITQKEKRALILNEREFKIENTAKSISVELKHNVDYDVEIPSDVDWVKQVTTRGLTTTTLKFDVAENKTNQARETFVMIRDKQSKISDKIKFVQEAGNVAVVDGVYNIETPGTLAEVIANYTTKPDTITTMTVTGTLNVEDYKVFPKIQYLQTLNLSEAHSVNDEIPARAFRNQEEFAGYSYLRSLRIPNSTKKLGFRSFGGAVSVAKYLKEIPYGVEVIGVEAFTEVSDIPHEFIPESVKEIGDRAFKFSQGDGLIIPKSVEKVGRGAFGQYSQRTPKPFIIEEGVKMLMDSVFARTYFYTYDGAVITIPSTVEYIGKSAFAQSDITGVIFKEGALKNIDDYAFFWMSTLVGTVTIPKGVERIGKNAFAMCPSIKRLELNEGLKVIDAHAFQNCYIANDIIFPSTLKVVAEEAFSSNYKIASLTTNDGLEEIGNRAFQSCENITGALRIPGTVKKLGVSAFSDCKKITNLQLDKGVSEIGNYAFHNTSISSAIVPGSVKRIGEGAFGYCDKLTDFQISEGVEEIGAVILSSTPNLNIILTIPRSVKSIDCSAFSYNRLSGIKLTWTTPIDHPESDPVYCALIHSKDSTPFYVPADHIAAYRDKWGTIHPEYQFITY